MPDMPLDPRDREGHSDDIPPTSGGGGYTDPVGPAGGAGSQGYDPAPGSRSAFDAPSASTGAYDTPVERTTAYDTPVERTATYASPAGGAAYGNAGSGYGADPIVSTGAPLHQGVRNGFGTAALVLGILGLLSALFLVGGVLGLIAVILGAIGLGRVSRREATNRGSALAGVILGLLAMAISIGVAVAGRNFYNQNKEEFNNVTECLENAKTDAARTACADQFRDAVTP